MSSLQLLSSGGCSPKTCRSGVARHLPPSLSEVSSFAESFCGKSIRVVTARPFTVLKRAVVVMALLAVACALLVPALSAAQSPSPTSSLLVKLVDGLSAQEQADVIARDGGIERSVIPVLRLHVIEVPPSDLATVRANYQVDPQVVSVEENRTRDDLGIYLVVRPDRDRKSTRLNSSH